MLISINQHKLTFHTNTLSYLGVMAFLSVEVGEFGKSCKLCTCVPQLLTPFLFYDVISDMAYIEYRLTVV